MAELGSIKVEVAPEVSTREGGQTQLGGLASLATQAGDAAVEDVLGNLRDDLKGATGGSEAELNEIVVDDHLPTAFADNQLQLMRKLKRAVEQGNSSEASIAILKGKQILGSAIGEDPQLRDQLVAEFSQFVTTDSGLEALKFSDAQSSANARVSATQLSDITDFAQRSIDGLSIDPAVPVDSKLFAVEYVERSKVRQAIRDNAFRVEAQQANASRSVASKVDDYESLIVRETNIINSVIESGKVGYDQYAQALRDPQLASNQIIINDWGQFGQQRALDEVTLAIGTLEQQFADMFTAADLKDQDGAAILEDKNRAIEHLNNLGKLYQGDTIDGQGAWDLYNNTRKLAHRNARLQLDAQLFWAELMGPYIENAESLGVRDVLFADFAGNKLLDEAEHFAAMYMNGPAGTPNGGSPEIVLRAIDNNQKYSTKNGGTYSQDPQIQEQFNTQQLKLADWAVRQELQINPSSSPATMKVLAGVKAGLYRAQGSASGAPTQETMGVFRADVGSDTFLQMVKLAGTDNPENGAVVTAMGMSALSLWSRQLVETPEGPKQGFDARILQVTSLLTAPVGSFTGVDIRLVDVIKTNINTLEKEGRVVMSVDRDEATRRLKSDKQPLGDSQINSIIEGLERQAAQMSELVTSNTRVNAHIMKAQNPSSPVDYNQSYRTSGMFKIFPFKPEDQ